MIEKVVGLISGGIDSPLAILRSGGEFDVLPLHFCTYPKTPKKNSLITIKVLKDIKNKVDFEKVIVFPWAGMLNEIIGKVKEKYACVACKRCMLITASKICRDEEAAGIITGESLGQKASQTIENISAISSGIELPVLRPLIGMNKEEIIKLSRESGLYRADHAGPCPAVPSKPRTKAKPKEIEGELEKIDLEEKLEEGRKNVLEVKNLNQDLDGYFSNLEERF